MHFTRHCPLNCSTADTCHPPPPNTTTPPHHPGIELRGKERRSRGIDYNAEVAFEKKPAPGFYDTGSEVAMTRDMQQEFRPTTVEEMEGKRRKVG